MLARPKLVACLALVVGSLCSFAQQQDIYIRIRGKIVNEKDSSGVKTALLYEKLPYYDDMGRIASGDDGSFEFYLIRDLEYNININQEGFEPFSLQVKVEDPDNDKSMNVDFNLTPVEVPEEPEEEIFTLNNLIFNSGSSVIGRGSYSGLDEFVQWLKERPSYIVQLEGHTDIDGNPDANMRLSLARVESVKDYITKKGVKKNRVLTKAFGGTKPLTTERTPEARRSNRRVEVRVIGR